MARDRVSIDEFPKVVMASLEEYVSMASEEVKEAVHTVSEVGIGGAGVEVLPGIGVVADGVLLHHSLLDGDAGAHFSNVHQKATSRSVARM